MAFPLVTKVFDALNATLDLPARNGLAIYRFQVTGAGTMTLRFQDSSDGGTTFTDIRVFNETTAAVSTDITAAGIYRVMDPQVLMRPRLIAALFTSGTLTGYVSTVALSSLAPMPVQTAVFTAGGQSRGLSSASAVEALVTIDVTGAASMTTQLQDSMDDGVTFTPLRLTNVATGAQSTDITADGRYALAESIALIAPRLAVTAFTSGTRTIRYVSAAIDA